MKFGINRAARGDKVVKVSENLRMRQNVLCFSAEDGKIYVYSTKEGGAHDPAASAWAGG